MVYKSQLSTRERFLSRKRRSILPKREERLKLLEGEKGKQSSLEISKRNPRSKESMGVRGLKRADNRAQGRGENGEGAAKGLPRGQRKR